jgi:hypothetical protein
MKQRLNRAMPSAAMAVALLALGIAIGGGAYAAATKLKKNSVKTKTIKNKAVTEAKLADGAVSAAKIKDGAVGAAKITDGAVSAAKISGGAVTSAKLGACPTGTILFAGGCFETTARAVTDWYTASNTCGAAGGRLPLATELMGVRSQPGIDLGSNGGSTGNWAGDMVANSGDTIDDTGAMSVSLPANVTSRPYRCVLPRS